MICHKSSVIVECAVKFWAISYFLRDLPYNCVIFLLVVALLLFSFVVNSQGGLRLSPSHHTQYL